MTTRSTMLSLHRRPPRSSLRRATRCPQHTLAAAVLLALPLLVADGREPPASPAATTPAPFNQAVPGSVVTLEMLPIPAPDGGGTLWISKTEIPWDLYDVFVYSLDEGDDPPPTADAVTRPSRPYIPPDRGYGHDGYPAISMTAHGAAQFCAWLSKKTGRSYRLPTETEWEHACLAGSKGPYAFGESVAELPNHAWFAANANATTHPTGGKQPNAWGLHDMHGNAAEWTIGVGGKPVARGGSFLDDAAACRADARMLPNPSWNASDPQIPKSTWWLADAPFIGFRVVCDPAPTPTPPAEQPPEKPYDEPVQQDQR